MMPVAPLILVQLTAYAPLVLIAGDTLGAEGTAARSARRAVHARGPSRSIPLSRVHSFLEIRVAAIVV